MGMGRRAGLAGAIIVAILVVITLANRQASAPSARPLATPAPGAMTPASALATAASQALVPGGKGIPGFNPVAEWPLVRLGAVRLWGFSTGAGVKVAVVDTGIDNGQRDLSGAVVKVIGAPGDQSNDSHGTAVAGLIAGRGSAIDPSHHVAGLAPRADLIDVRVATQASGVSAGAIADGITAAAMAGARVVNVSLSVPADDPQHDITNAVRFAQGRDCLVVASAGPAGPANYPAVVTNVLAVAGVTQAGVPMASLALYTPSAVYAPGADLVSTAEIGPAGGGHGGYITGISGNDYAAAYVSATAALMFAADPRLTADQARMLIAPQGLTTPGILDPFGLLRSLRLNPPPPAPQPTPIPPQSAQSPARAGSPSVTAGSSYQAARPGPRSPMATVAILSAILAVLLVLFVIILRRFFGGNGGGRGPRGGRPAIRRPDLTTLDWRQW